MTLRKLLAMAAAFVVLLLATNAAADPLPPERSPVAVMFAPGEALNLRVRSESNLQTDGGAFLRLPADVRILDAATWAKLDAEVHRLQDVETRLGAENETLRTSVRTAPPVGWGTALAVLAGLGAGMAAGYWAFHH